MIQKIQAFEIQGRGTATESKIEVQSRFTTGDKAVIYYDLRDPNGTTQARKLVDNTYVTLPYAILSRNLIRVTGNDRDAVVGDEKQAIVIFKRERTDVSVINGKVLALSMKDSRDVCTGYSKGITQTLYLDTEDLLSASIISETEDMQNILNTPYYVSDGIYVRYWKGESFDENFQEQCRF